MKDKNAEKGSIQKDTESATPLHNICSSPNVCEMVEWIQIVGTRKSALAKDKDKNTPLLVAIENRKVTKSVIIALAALNPEAAKIDNAKGKSPFHAAIRKKAEEDVVKEVIKMHPKAVKKVSFKGNNNIFHEMCQYETAAGIISGLLSVHPDGAKSQNDKGNLPLHVAAAYHVSPQIINALVKAYPEGCLVQNTTKEIPL
jgi:ankyrin repeat protein